MLLRQVGERLRAALRASDTVARLGGDEFAVLLPGADRRARTGPLASSCPTLEPPSSWTGITSMCGISIGVALYPDHGRDAETLLRRADVAMYVAKRAAPAMPSTPRTRTPTAPPAWPLIGDLRRR